jgi:hypothetical protein
MFAMIIVNIYTLTIYSIMSVVETVDDLMKYLENNYVSDTNTVDHLSISESIDEPLVVEKEGIVNKPAEYVYLNDNILSNETGSKRDYDISYNLHVCLFAVNQELPIPFLEYMFIQSNDHYMFPMAAMETNKFNQIRVASLSDDIDEDEQTTDELLRQCSQLLKTYISIDGVNMDDIYRGFLEDDNQNIYAFFDGSAVNRSPSVGQIIDVALITDIMSGYLLGRPINPHCLHVFKINPFIRDIKDQDRQIVPRPVSAYPCKETEDGKYENIYYSEDDDVSTKMSVLIAPVNHEEYGSLFLFTLEPINATYNRIQRFALFSGESAIDDDMSESEEEVSDTEDEEESVQDLEIENREPETENHEIGEPSDLMEADDTQEESETKPESEQEDESESEPVSEQKDESESEPESEQEDESESEPESEQEDESESEPESEQEDESELESNSVSDEDVLIYTEDNVRYCGVYTADLFTEI